MRVRQRDIAQAAGVSQATVSLVVSGRASEGGVSAVTQARVRAAMEELGYVPDLAARSLRGGRSGLVGVFTYEPVFPARPDEYFHEFLVGIEVGAADHGQDLVLFSSTQQADGRRSIYAGGSSRLQHVDGSIILGMFRDDAELSRLVREEYPFVSIGQYDPVPEAAWVAVDYDRAVHAIMDDLHRGGHRRIAYVHGDDQRLPSLARRSAFARAGTGDDSVFLASHDLTPETVAEWRREGVTAVMAENPQVAEDVERCVSRSGLRVPDDFAAAALEVPIRSGRAAGWSHLIIPKRDIGIRSVAVLSAILDGKLPHDHHETMQCLPHHLGTLPPIE